MTAPPRPTGKLVRLGVMLLEERTPASTTLDVLLAGLFLSPDSLSGTMADPAAQPPAVALPLAPLDPATTVATPLAEPQPATATRDERPTTSDDARRTDRFDPVAFDLPARSPYAVTLSLPTPTTGDGGGGVLTAATDLTSAGQTVSTLDAASSGGSAKPFGDTVFAANYGPPPPPGYPPPPSPPAPTPQASTLALTLETPYVQVNANDTNKSPWQRYGAGSPDAGKLKTGLPRVRDFDVRPMRDLSGWTDYTQLQPPAGGALIGDPELKTVTVAYTGPVREISLQIRVVASSP